MDLPHDIGEKTTRRASIGIICGFVVGAIGLAPGYHRQAVLEGLDIAVLSVGYQETELSDERHGKIDELTLRLENQTGEPLDPLVSTWDQRRKTRHNWHIENDIAILGEDQTAELKVVSPDETANIHAGVHVQITVYQRGKQRWKSEQFKSPELHSGIDL